MMGAMSAANMTGTIYSAALPGRFIKNWYLFLFIQRLPVQYSEIVEKRQEKSPGKPEKNRIFLTRSLSKLPLPYPVENWNKFAQKSHCVRRGNLLELNKHPRIFRGSETTSNNKEEKKWETSAK